MRLLNSIFSMLSYSFTSKLHIRNLQKKKYNDFNLAITTIFLTKV